jgi:hypothetical protein
MKFLVLISLLITNTYAATSRAEIIEKITAYDAELLSGLESDEVDSVILSTEKIMESNASEEATTNFFSSVQKSLRAYRAYKKNNADTITDVKNLAKEINANGFKSSSELKNYVLKSKVKFGFILDCNTDTEANQGAFVAIAGLYNNKCTLLKKKPTKYFKISHYLLGVGLHMHAYKDYAYLFCALGFPQAKTYNLTLRAGIGALARGANVAVSIGENGICLQPGVDHLAVGVYAGVGLMTVNPEDY